MSAVRPTSTPTGGASARASALLARPGAGTGGRTGPGADDPRTRNARLVVCAIALGLAPVLMVLGNLFVVDTGDEAAQEVADIAADRNLFLAGNVLFALGAAALIPGAIALASLVRARGAGWMTTGACMIALGGGSLAVALWSYTIVGYLGTDDGVPRDGLVALFDRGNDSALFAVAWLIGVGALIGMILAGIGLMRARAVPLWQPILLIVAPFLLFVGGEDGLLSAVLTLPLVVALGVLAYEAIRVSRSPAAGSAVPPAADRIDRTDAEPGMPAPREGVEPAGRRDPAAGSTSVG
jgi:MFS family permease